MAADGSFSQRYGPWALVTGAARGLGAEFAHRIAALGVDVVLVDRLAGELTETARSVSAATGRATRTVVCDLTHSRFIEAIRESTVDLEIGLLVNNAAFSTVGPFLDQDVELLSQMIDANARAPMILTHHFGQAMRARKRGGVVIMSSASSLFGVPLVAQYAATKAYDSLLAQSLWAEWEGSGVDVLAVLPGNTDTPGLRGSRPDLKGLPVMSARATVTEALDALGVRPAIIPGAGNRMAMRVLGWLPGAMAIRAVARTVRRMYANSPQTRKRDGDPD